MKPFPLVPWLEKANNLKLYLFARQAGPCLPDRLCLREWRAVHAVQSTRCLMAIEAGTNGEVTLRQQVEWMEQKRAEMEAQKEVA